MRESQEKCEALLQKKFLNKRVSVKADIHGQKKVNVVGNCDFIGWNKFLQKRQITIGRMPIFTETYQELEIKLQ